MSTTKQNGCCDHQAGETEKGTLAALKNDMTICALEKGDNEEENGALSNWLSCILEEQEEKSFAIHFTISCVIHYLQEEKNSFPKHLQTAFLIGLPQEWAAYGSGIWCFL